MPGAHQWAPNSVKLTVKKSSGRYVIKDGFLGLICVIYNGPSVS